MPITNWEITHEDFDLLILVAERVERELNDYPDERRTLVMDLNACHSNGCPLDFAGLLTASLGDLSHDIYGIRKAIDRTTGHLSEDCFMPRYALANRVGSPTGITIDLTPRGCTTLEGNARVAAAMKQFDDTAASLANACMQFLDEWGSTLGSLLEHGGSLSTEDRVGLEENLDQLAELAAERKRTQEEFLRSVAGAPPAPEREAHLG